MRPVTLREVITSHPFSIGVSATLADAQKLMRKRRIHHVPVMSGATLVGVLSLDDIHLAQTLSAYDPATTGVEEAMQSPLTVGPTEPVNDVVAQMVKQKRDAVLVVECGQVLGIFTTVDAMRTLSRVLARHRPEPHPIPDY